MEDKSKKEELQSRRDFFKKAAKTALPILGAVVLSGVPGLLKAEETPMGCQYGCSYTCSGSCKNGCDGCKYTCSGSCKNGCEGCRYTCTGTCKNSCLSTCSHTSA